MTRAAPVRRVAAYVDGYNVYYGLKSKGMDRYLWLDYDALLRTQLKSDETLVGVTLFTALGRRQSTGAEVRQSRYLDALRYMGRVNVVTEGRFEVRPWRCSDCGRTTKRNQEKKTDVSIAVTMLGDAVDGLFDTAFLLSADADLVPAVEAVRQRGKRVCTCNQRSSIAGVGQRSERELAHLKGQVQSVPAAGHGSQLCRGGC